MPSSRLRIEAFSEKSFERRKWSKSGGELNFPPDLTNKHLDRAPRFALRSDPKLFPASDPYHLKRPIRSTVKYTINDHSDHDASKILIIFPSSFQQGGETPYLLSFCHWAAICFFPAVNLPLPFLNSFDNSRSSFFSSKESRPFDTRCSKSVEL